MLYARKQLIMISRITRKMKFDFISSGRVETKDSFISLFSLHFLGMFFGAMAGSFFFAEYSSSSVYTRIIIDVLFILLQLFFSTSFLGIVLVPILVMFRGFVLSAILASTLFFTGSDILMKAILIVSVPSLIFMTGFILLSRNCLLRSICLLRQRSYFYNNNFGNLLYCTFMCVVLITIEFIYCLLIFPLVT